MTVNRAGGVESFLRYQVECGACKRWGPLWQLDDPRRADRLDMELEVIQKQGFSSYFLILARIMDWMRTKNIVYGPGRGSVGGSLVAYCLHIHEADPLQWDLSFSRFINPDRVAFPDVDIDVSQRERQDVLSFIREEFGDDETAVLGVAAFAKAGARTVVDMMVAAHEHDPDAVALGEQLKRMLPEGAAVTGGTRQERELEFWLGDGKIGNQKQFIELAQKAGWYETLLKLDGVQTHLQQHAAGVVIISKEDLKRLPQTSADGKNMMTGYDMYALDELSYLKIDILGLRTLDILADAHKTIGGSGSTLDLMKLWEHTSKSDQKTYELLRQADTLGVFQVETSGYRRTLKDFKPICFEDIVQLNALYRPGALDVKREGSNKNMVDIYIDRRNGREPINYNSLELKSLLGEELKDTQGIILFQEQAMELVKKLAGFSDNDADNLRKAIGKKQPDRMARIWSDFESGMLARGHSKRAAGEAWKMMEGAARYSWNKSHSVFYGTITYLCAFLKANERVEIPELELSGPGKAAFYCALINSLADNAERQANAIAEARQHVRISPPDVNIAEDHYIVQDGQIVFGLNGIKGMGASNRDSILIEHLLNGNFKSFEDFHRRLPSVPINMKLALIRCGAFDKLEDRSWLLARTQRANGKEWTVAEFIKHNCGLKKPRELPLLTEVQPPSDRELAEGELSTIGFYVTSDPMADVNTALKRLDSSTHWGGQVETVKTWNDRNGNEMARFTLLTPALTKLRVQIFASNWAQCVEHIKKGNRVVVRGRMDGTMVLAEAAFTAGDYRHFQVLECSKDGKRDIHPFSGQMAVIEAFEDSGYVVRLH